MTEPNSSDTSKSKSRIITQVLTKAIKLWLRTQLSQVSQIAVQIGASDREILSGCVPSVSIFASGAVYQGLHITQIALDAQNIQINIGSVVRGKPLQLLDTVPVVAELIVEEQDLNNSLSSELLSTALNDLLVKLLPEYCPKSKPIFWEKISLDDQRLILRGSLLSAIESSFLEIFAGLQLFNAQELQLTQVQILQNQVALLDMCDEYNLYLGSDVKIQALTVIPGKLVCRGQINVNP
ncbi:DUF2993 domain-containing protein [Cronbergia sp. UHCC 0137]|uniref:LmeA family phospholipid-binding protein n=1 Tax=Cronbergia sp. UHCC 0137 TaxID=3110239 RepID=UPI002B217BD4|nr:DUF2993 domain-containing protein [Cronbergia sp. UHCC 0137]MEA5620243.1 DUF2993 domain-containing protein [Cronbergia sp. UHCC 0137]